MKTPEQYAETQFGWSLEEFGDARNWLIDIRNMLQREVDSIESGKATAETYGESIGHNFVQGNKAGIERINEVLK